MDKKIKILFVINNLGVGGAERLVIDDINEMLRRGIPVRLLTLKKEPKFSLSGDCLIEKKDWRVINFGSLFNLFDWIRVFLYIKKEKPDIAYTNLWFSNLVVRVAGRLVGIPKIISFEHNIYDTIKNQRMFFVDMILQSLSYRIIAVSEAVKKSLIKHGIKKDKIEVILNGMDISKYKNLHITALDGEPKKDFTFVFVGRLIHQKAVDILLRAFAIVGKGKLLIAGDGAEKENLIKLTKELDITNRVKFLGIRKDIPEILSYADCFVMPSRFEGLGMVLLEAIASNKVVIISDFEAGSEIIKDGYNGYVFPIDNYSVLAEKMLESINHNNIMENSDNFAQEFSIIRHVDKLINL